MYDVVYLGDDVDAGVNEEANLVLFQREDQEMVILTPQSVTALRTYIDRYLLEHDTFK